MRPSTLLATFTLAALLLALSACGEEKFARVLRIEHMSQTIGGPAAVGRPGDYLLENDRLRAVIHGRHNARSVLPIANGSLVDLDIQRPAVTARVGQGKDAFYELGPMVNLKVNSSRKMQYGACGSIKDAFSTTPCPRQGCVRVSAQGPGEDIMGILGLLDLAIKRSSFISQNLIITTDYDVCPSEPFVRVTTSAKFSDKAKTVVNMEELPRPLGLMDVLLGENTGKSCNKDSDCDTASGETCASLLLELPMGNLDIKMRRCQKPDQKLAGLLAGDFTFFSAKVNVFVPGDGFNHESYIRSVFDTGGDTFTYPLATDFIAGIADGVSYAYFNKTGKAMVPVFTSAFTAAMTNRYACPHKDPTCMKGKEMRFSRYVAVGQGDIASALTGFFQVRGIKTGELRGHVIDARTREPVSGANVYAMREPRAWRGLSDDDLRARLAETTLDAFQALSRKESATKANAFGQSGILDHFKSDVGLDKVADGSFGGQLPVHPDWCQVDKCRYVLVAYDRGRPASRLAVVRITQGQESRVTLTLGDSGVLRYRIQDRTGQTIPSKLTIGHCFPECGTNADCQDRARPVCDVTVSGLSDPRGICIPRGGYTGPTSCRVDQSWDNKAGTCVCQHTGLMPLSMQGHRYSDGTVETVLAGHGQGEVRLEPGVYQVLASRGPEYSIRRQFVTIRPGTVTDFVAALARVVDTTGWISADFHVHGPNSVDAPATYNARVRSMVAEGVELVTATDHDHITDYNPTINHLGLRPWIKGQVGIEVSPLDYGHFIGFPLKYNELASQNGAFNWRRGKTAKEMAGLAPWEADWINLTPGEIFKKLREMGSLGVEKTVVFVAHFYDHFTFYDVDPLDLSLPATAFDNITSLFNPVLAADNFSGKFDGLEAFNGKNQDLIRRPTYAEIKGYNKKLVAYLKASKGKAYDDLQRGWGRISAAAQREFLRRTPTEQRVAISYSNKNFQCRCMADAECGSGAVCSPDTGACMSACTSDASCETTLVAAGREACLAKGSEGGKVCQRVKPTCQVQSDCGYAFSKDSSGKPKVVDKCMAGFCELPCSSSDDCSADKKRPACDKAKGVCVADKAATSLDPCVQLRGTVDDWFQMLNRGVRRTLLGDSDTHDIYSIESGTPRNYVRSSTDIPQGIRLDEVAANVKRMSTFPTYGPFVEVSANGKHMGETVNAVGGKPVTLSIRVQSPLWFDVDRIEVYRNGLLIRTITGKVDCKVGDATCIRSPNDRVVDYDGTVTDTPKKDSWYVVAVMGLNGKSMAPVYSSTPVARLGMYELIQRLTPLLPPLKAFRVPLSPSMTTVRPYAITNPIFAEVDGKKGLTPVAAMPSWATAKDREASGEATGAGGSASQGLTSGRAPAHNHSSGLGKMIRDTARLRASFKRGEIDPKVIQKALLQVSMFSFHGSF